MENIKKAIPIFFAVDDSYVPFLAVTLESLVENSSSNNNYDIKDGDKEKLVAYEFTKPNNHLGVDEFINHVTKKIYQ